MCFKSSFNVSNVLYVIQVFFFSPSALLRRATVYHHMGNFQMATEDLKIVLMEEPQNAAATVGDKLNTRSLFSTRYHCICLSSGTRY